jgi:hypothetical protein
MTKQILKPVLIGVLIGGAFYVMPFFFLPGFFVFIILGLTFRFLFWGRRWPRGWHQEGIHPAFADSIRKMTDEEYDAFKKKFDQHRMSADDPNKS